MLPSHERNISPAHRVSTNSPRPQLPSLVRKQPTHIKFVELSPTLSNFSHLKPQPLAANPVRRQVNDNCAQADPNVAEGSRAMSLSPVQRQLHFQHPHSPNEPRE